MTIQEFVTVVDFWIGVEDPLVLEGDLLSSIRLALGPGSPLCSSFFDAPDSTKTKVLLGAPSDDPNVDRRVDIAFRKFLLRVEALRCQNFAASNIVPQ